jgi:hypothetical protein
MNREIIDIIQLLAQDKFELNNFLEVFDLV